MFCDFYGVLIVCAHDEFMKAAISMIKDHGRDALRQIELARQSAVTQRDSEMIDYWTKVMKSYKSIK